MKEKIVFVCMGVELTCGTPRPGHRLGRGGMFEDRVPSKMLASKTKQMETAGEKKTTISRIFMIGDVRQKLF